MSRMIHRDLVLQRGGATLPGDLMLPPRASGLVIFAHGSGSSRLSPRNREVASALNEAGLATLLLALPESQLTGLMAVPLLTAAAVGLLLRQCQTMPAPRVPDW